MGKSFDPPRLFFVYHSQSFFVHSGKIIWPVTISIISLSYVSNVNLHSKNGEKESAESFFVGNSICLNRLSGCSDDSQILQHLSE